MVAVNVAADRCHLHVITDWHFTSSSLLFFTTCLYKNRKKLTTSRRHHILPIIPYSNCIWQYAVRWLLALCSQFHCHRANAWFHIHPPPPCKANVASLPCRSHAVLLSSCSLLRRRRDLLSDLQTGSERGHTFTNSTISAQFRDHIDFPCNHSPAHKLRGDWAASAGGAVTADSAPFWLAKSPSLSLVHPRLVRLVPPCTACKWSGNGDAPPRHDNTQHRVQLSWTRAVYELVKDNQVNPKTGVHWRPRDCNRCHCWRGWHQFIYFRSAFKEACFIVSNKYLCTGRASFMASCVSFTQLFTPMHRQTVGE